MFDWKAIVGLIIIICVFTYAGLWWGILSLVVITITLGWKHRHDGPFPTSQTTTINEVDESAIDRLVEQEILGEKLDHLCEQLEDPELQDEQRTRLENQLKEVSARLKELSSKRKSAQKK